jgi:raffinose/stachyose/melibiose transport system substrate-binding protein
MAAAFKKETGITVECYTNTEENHISEKYAAGEPYNITMMDYPDVADYKDYLYDLSNEKWVKDGGNDYGLKLDGKVYGFPFVIEAMGMIYNAEAIEKITGETFNWKDYSTLESFKGLLEKLKAGGMKSPVAVNKDDWSLASHVFGQFYCLRDNGSENASLSFVDKLKKGEASLSGDTNYNAIMDTIDTLLKYNINASDPLSASYDVNDQDLSEGKVAFWPNGSWATDVSKHTDKVGIMPLPINAKDTSLSQKLVSGATKMLTVDAKYSSEKQQKAALKFLNWLVYSDAGQDFLVNKCSLIVAFSNITLKAKTPLSASVSDFIKNGQSTYWYQAMPSDHNTVMGAALQKYISGGIKRDKLANDVEAYWKGKK